MPTLDIGRLCSYLIRCSSLQSYRPVHTAGDGNDVNISALLTSFQEGYDKKVRPNYGGKLISLTSTHTYSPIDDVLSLKLDISNIINATTLPGKFVSIANIIRRMASKGRTNVSYLMGLVSYIPLLNKNTTIWIQIFN